MSATLEDLLDYWFGDLSPERSGWLEEQLFADEGLAARLELVVRLQEGLRGVIRRGQLQSGVSLEAVRRFEREGLILREYRIEPDQVVPCSIDAEDLVVVRLAGAFEGTEAVDVVMEAELEGLGPSIERSEGVPVDRSTGEVVLVFPGDRVRALPRSFLNYRVLRAVQETLLGVFGMDHHPTPLRSG